MYVSIPKVTLQFQRLAFGLSNAGAVYSQIVEKLLASIPEDKRVVYFDDILLHTKTVKEHITSSSKSWLP